MGFLIWLHCIASKSNSTWNLYKHLQISHERWRWSLNTWFVWLLLFVTTCLSPFVSGVSPKRRPIGSLHALKVVKVLKRRDPILHSLYGKVGVFHLKMIGTSWFMCSVYLKKKVGVFHFNHRNFLINVIRSNAQGVLDTYLHIYTKHVDHDFRTCYWICRCSPYYIRITWS